MTKNLSRFRPKTLALIVFLLFLVFSWVILFFIGSVALDPDFGWHLRMGELITKSGIPHTDPFSYTMPSYPYVDHEWLLNIFLHFLYPMIGMVGLSAILATIAIAALIVIIPRSMVIYSLVPATYVFSVMLSRFAVRPQVISWLYFAFLVRIFSSLERWKRWRVFLPFLIFVWGNTHGSFALGIVFILIYIVTGAIQRRRIDSVDAVVFLLSVGATFLTPYGGRTWWEVWMTLTDGSLHSRIIEWFPSYSRPEFGLIATVAFIALIVVKFRSLVHPHTIIFLGVSGVMAGMSLRHVPYFVFLSVPIILQWFVSMHGTARRLQGGERRFWIFYMILCFVSTGFLSIDVFRMVPTAYDRSQAGAYPGIAVQYLDEYPHEGNLFTLYGWGGYVLWKLPDKKVFIDGRMPSFRIKTPNGDIVSAMDQYMSVAEGKDVEKIFNSYTITRVLLPVSTKKNPFVAGILYKLGYIGGKNISSLRDELIRNKWTVVYQDDQAVAYQRPVDTTD